MTHTRREEADAPGPLADGGGFWPLLGKGMAMGVAEVVPGVSGGTIAFVTGIYDQLVRAFASFSQLSLKLLANDWRGFARRHNLAFLAVLGAGMAIGFAAVAQVVLWLLASYGVHVFGLFFGLIAGAVFAVGAQSQWRWLGTIGVAGLAIGLAVGLLVEPAAMRTEPSTALLFAAGALAATAWILPRRFRLVRAVAARPLPTAPAIPQGAGTGNRGDVPGRRGHWPARLLEAAGVAA